MEAGFHSISHYNLVRKFVSMRQAMNIPDAKSRSGQRMGETRKVASAAIVQSKNARRRSHLDAQKEREKVHFATLMGICRFKRAELEPKYQQYKGRVVHRGDIVNDDSGACAVFTGRGSSASQMSAAKVLVPDCTISAYTQVKLEDAPKLLRIPNSECPDIWIRLPRHKWPKSW